MELIALEIIYTTPLVHLTSFTDVIKLFFIDYIQEILYKSKNWPKTYQKRSGTKN